MSEEEKKEMPQLGVRLPADVTVAKTEAPATEAGRQTSQGVLPYCECQPGKDNPGHQYNVDRIGMVCLFCNKPRKPTATVTTPQPLEEAIASMRNAPPAPAQAVADSQPSEIAQLTQAIRELTAAISAQKGGTQ